MFKTTTQIRVRYAETDQMGVVYHSNYFLYFEVARAESIRQLGFTYADMEKVGVIMPVIEVKCKYIRPALYDQLLTITVELRQLPTDYKITFHSEVLNEQNELLAMGHVTLYFMEAKTMKKSTMPDILFDKIKPYFELPNEAPPV
ncbi:MAG: acyl-CoA thioesterase [Niabella sp.]